MPVVTMIAGPNGSGKSTLTAELLKAGLHIGEYFNADDIARELAGTPSAIAAEAQAIVRERRELAMREMRDHSFETVMSHVSHIEFLRTARAAGFETRLVFVATDDPGINQGRVANRVKHGGHDVPRDRITSRYWRCLENLPAAIAAADHSLIFDNSSDRAAFSALAEIRNGYLRHLGMQSVLATRPCWWLEILPLIKAQPVLKDGLIL